MHLWPSTRIRDSFKHDYIKKLDLNFHRMKIQKHQHQQQQQQSSSKQNLLDKEQSPAAEGDGNAAEKSDSVSFGQRVLEFGSEALLLLSCCFCCYCCGACYSEEEEN